MRRTWKGLFGSEDGAVAPTVALSLFALVACGGLAFDYARMAGMDTELQQAADQAALAAATQLDRLEDSQDRASGAITAAGTSNRLANNITRFANDNVTAGMAVEIADITFCEEFDDSVEDTMAACTEADAGDGQATRYVIVTTSARTANYAFTPIVAALSQSSSATAVAGIESSICNVAPLLVCVTDDEFPTDADIGRGLRLKPLDGVSGNYGLLDFGNGNPAVIDALLGHGLNGCQSTDDNETEPGTKNVTDAINTRMDVYGGGPATSDPDDACVVSDGAGCPALNTRKDVIVKLEVSDNNSTATTPPAAAGCPADPAAAGEAFEIPVSPIRSFARDNCHYTDTCGTGIDSNLGNKIWNIADYVAQNHPGTTAADIATEVGGGKTATTLTRYDIYKWEMIDDDADESTPPPRLATKAFVTSTSELKPNGRYNHTTTTQCTYSQAKFASTAYPAQKDRRILPVVAANCDELNGKGAAYEDYTLLRVFDVFLTEPSMQRTYPGFTDNKEIYGEVIGPAQTFEGGGGFQYYSRNKPYLIR